MLLVIFLAMVIIIAYIYLTFREGYTGTSEYGLLGDTNMPVGCQGVDVGTVPPSCRLGQGNFCTESKDSVSCLEKRVDGQDPDSLCCQWVDYCKNLPTGTAKAKMSTQGYLPLSKDGCYGKNFAGSKGDGSDITYGTWQNYNDACCEKSCEVSLPDQSFLEWVECKSGVVQSGQKCKVKCTANASPSSKDSSTKDYYTCDNGQTQTPTLTCTENPTCTLPSTTVFQKKGWEIGSGNDAELPCKPGSSIRAGESCNIKCHGSPANNTAPTAFTCSSKGTTFTASPDQACHPHTGPEPGPSPGPQPGPACLSAKYGCCKDGKTAATDENCSNCASNTCGPGGDCTYARFPESLNFKSGDSNGCNLNGGTLAYQETCTLKCAPGYISTGTGEIGWVAGRGACSAISSFTCKLPQGTCTQVECPIGKTINPDGNCSTITCNTSQDIDSCCMPSASCDGVCSNSPWVTNGKKYCNKPKGKQCEEVDCCVQQCTMVDESIWKKNNWTSTECKPGELFKESCSIRCAPGYIPQNNTVPTRYTCNSKGEATLSNPDFKCVPGGGACTIPELPEHTISNDPTRCGPGRVINAGESCKIECNMDINAWKSSGTTEYICNNSGSGFSEIPSLTCVLPTCGDTGSTICNGAQWMPWDASKFSAKTCTGTQGCTPDDCCDEAYTCVAHECDAGTTKRQNAPQYCKNMPCKNSECCTPTPNGDCSLFGCGAGYHPSDGTCEGPCQQHDCCTPNPTCSDTKANGGYECDESKGEVFYGRSITCKGSQCTAKDCCQLKGTCNHLECPAGSHAIYDPKGTKGTCAEAKCTLSECCQENPVCTDESCGGGWVLKGDSELPAHCKESVCKQEECCFQLATCDNVKCQTGSTKKEVPPPFCRSSFCTNEECCETNDKCEPTLCGEGSHLKEILPDYCQEKTCSTAECCNENPTCANFYCGPGQRVLNSNHICEGYVCENSECCTDNVTCDTYGECPEGRTFKKNYQNIVCREEKCTDADCCDPLPLPTCQNYTCPSRMNLKGNANAIKCAGVACVDDECCIPEPKPTCFGAKYVCPPNFTPRADGQSITCQDYTCQTNECCEPNAKCETINCPENMVPKSGNIICEGATCKPEECCTAKATCQNFLCADGFQITDPKYTCRDALCQFDECCELVPPGPPKKRTTIRRTDARNYFGGTDTFNFDDNKKMASTVSKRRDYERRRYLQKHYQQHEEKYKDVQTQDYGRDIQFNLLTPIPYSDAFAVEGRKEHNIQPSLARLTFADLP